MDKYPLQSYADYSSFSTIVITDDMAAIYKKAATELMRNWGYDSEGCFQETFEACGEGAAMVEEYATYLTYNINPMYVKKLSAEQSIA